MRYLFVDADTDGLYGRFLAVAALACDEQGGNVESFSCRWDYADADVESRWVRENVLSTLKNRRILPTEEDMLEEFWSFYRKQGKVLCVGDVTYPVECRLFEKCVRLNMSEREFEGPYPFLDLGSMLYACGMDPDSDRSALVGAGADVLDDAHMSYEIWKKYIKPKEERTCETCYANDMDVYEIGNPCWNCKGTYSEWMPKEGATRD